MARESFGKGNPRGKRATLVVQNKSLQSEHDSLPRVAAAPCLNLYWKKSDGIKLRSRKETGKCPTFSRADHGFLRDYGPSKVGPSQFKRYMSFGSGYIANFEN